MRKVPDWHAYYMLLAETASLRSKDPNTQVGAIIVDSSNRVIGTGYNGFKPGAEETPKLWERPEKYKHVVHAEKNALKFSGGNTEGGAVYCTLMPCIDCAQYVVEKKIKSVYFRDYREEFSGSLVYLKGNNVKCFRVKDGVTKEYV